MRVIRTQIAAALDVVLQVERHEDGKRRLVSIQEIVGMEGDIITMSELFRFDRRGLDDSGNVMGEYRATGVVPRFRETLERRGIACPLELFNSDRRETWA
jgi:pilus assembly protein CpaF